MDFDSENLTDYKCVDSQKSNYNTLLLYFA